MEKYVFLREIGSGSFGKVFLVKSKQKGINYVVKQVDLNKLDRKELKSATKEVEVLAKLKHNNIVSYKESYEKNNQLNIVLEYCENGDLHDKIKEKRLSNIFFGENEILDYFVQICLALDYIHEQKILHRDLKTKNIFLTKGNIIKLGDFGIAKVLENSFELAQTCIGSPFYVSPEICESKPYNRKSDVWALGCVLYELVTLKYAFVAKNVKTLVTKILTGVYNPLPTNMNIHIRSLICSMLKPNPKDRPSVRDILEKRFLIKKRATFICNARKKDFERRRSKSGDVKKNFPTINIYNNLEKKNGVKMKKLSLSCLHLNQFKYDKNFCPEAKYIAGNSGVKVDKKLCNFPLKTEENLPTPKEEEKRENSHVKGKKFPDEKDKDESNIKKENREIKKSIKLSKVDSEYYDLIAANDRRGKKVDFFDKKDFSLEEKNGGGNKDGGVLAVEEEDEGLQFHSDNNFVFNETQNESLPNERKNIKFETRKKWNNNTLQRNALLDVLSGSELLEGSLPFPQTQNHSVEKTILKENIDETLRLKPFEMKENVLFPLKIQTDEIPKENVKNNVFQLLQNEVKLLREKFESNNRKFQMEDLMKLRENCQRILNLQAVPMNLEPDRKMEESVFYNMEHSKVILERNIGFGRFFKSYEKIREMIFGDEEPRADTCLENEIDGTRTYVISVLRVTGDSDDVTKNTWKSIINILGDKLEHLPDIWELAMSENIYYYL